MNSNRKIANFMLLLPSKNVLFYYIMDSNQYAIELVTYLLVLVVYFYELIVCMLLIQ